MKALKALAAAGLLTLAPMGASALTVTLFEGGNSNQAVGFGIDQFVFADPSLPSDLNSSVGELLVTFGTDNYSGIVTASQSNTGNRAELTVSGVIFVESIAASSIPLTIVASHGGFELPFDNVLVTSEGDSSGADSAVSAAAFISANNNGGADDAASVDAAMNMGNTELTAIGSTDSSVFGETFASIQGVGDFSRTKTSVIANQDFALNSIAVIDDDFAVNDIIFFEFTTVATVPLPAPALLLLSALAGVGVVARRRKALEV
ncbi:MAG: hypothetical protein AAF526_00575 [Pseudomonadota bacterium]